MRKRMMTAGILLSLVIGLTACAKTAEDPEFHPVVRDSETEMPVEQTTDFKVALVTDSRGINDGAYNQAAWTGVENAVKNMRIRMDYAEAESEADYIPNIEKFVNQEYDLIICVGYQLADAVRQEASSNPQQHFVIIDDDSCSDLMNVTCVMFNQQEVGYLAGYLAGRASRYHVVGFVLGKASDTMHLFGYGFCAGVKDSDPQTLILQENIDSFDDAGKAAQAAQAMIERKADIIFHAAGGSGLGVISTCQSKGVYAIGVDTDQSIYAPENVLGSSVKRIDYAVEDVIRRKMDGSLSKITLTYDIADGGVDLIPSRQMSKEISADVTELKEKIKAGEIHVPSSREEFEEGYNTDGTDVYVLDE